MRLIRCEEVPSVCRASSADHSEGSESVVSALSGASFHFHDRGGYILGTFQGNHRGGAV